MHCAIFRLDKRGQQSLVSGQAWQWIHQPWKCQRDRFTSLTGGPVFLGHAQETGREKPVPGVGNDPFGWMTLLDEGLKQCLHQCLRDHRGFDPKFTCASFHQHEWWPSQEDKHPLLQEWLKIPKAEHVVPRWRHAHFPLPEPAVPKAKSSSESYWNVSKKPLDAFPEFSVSFPACNCCFPKSFPAFLPFSLSCEHPSEQFTSPLHRIPDSFCPCWKLKHFTLQQNVFGLRWEYKHFQSLCLFILKTLP